MTGLRVWLHPSSRYSGQWPVISDQKTIFVLPAIGR
jgi:hypothetical protein